MIGDDKPLLGVGIQVRQVAVHQFGGRSVAQHAHQRRVGAQQNAVRIAAANPVGSIGHQRAEIDFRTPQTLLSRTQGRIKGANQQRHKHK